MELDSDGDGLSDDFENQRYVYELIQGSFTWSQGREDAKERGGHLAIIENKIQSQEVVSMVEQVSTTNIWIGAFRESGVWKWVDNTAWGFTDCLWNHPIAGMW